MSFDVFEEIRRLQREIERLTRELTREFLRGPPEAIPERRGAPVEVKEALINLYETEDKYIIVAEMPGVSKESIRIDATETSIEIEGDVVEPVKEGRRILAERAYKKLRRSIRLPSRVKPEMAKAKYSDGLLVIELPKAEVIKRVSITIE
ncbi:MAG: hypothetical protein DRN15_00850 [Thermoprotei archaeon]|nr:MAG: hypothetical protein DRN15_00850 [Thermoprotei archaeon]RLF25387.1 MAG: hypothetical protein DRM97_01965 [Thermoprotei archaeon]